MTLLGRLVVETFRTLPARVAASMYRWTLGFHRPFDAYGDGTRAVCLRCKTDWPCDEFVRIDKEIAALGRS